MQESPTRDPYYPLILKCSLMEVDACHAISILVIYAIGRVRGIHVRPLKHIYRVGAGRDRLSVAFPGFG